MKLLNFTKGFALLALASTLFTSCDKVEEVEQIGDRGQILVKLIDGGDPAIVQFPIDFVPTPTTLVGADIRRDVPTAADLNRTMTVTVIDDTAAVTAAGLQHLDPSWYTIVPNDNITKVGGQGGTFTVVLDPGDFSQQIRIVVTDATVLDPSAKYGLAFTITSADHGTLSTNRTVIMEIGAKNIYDGAYQLNGIHNRPGYQFFYDTELHLVTTGANSVIMYWPLAGSVGHPIAVDENNTLSWYGPTVAPAVDFDPITNLATAIYGTNPAGPPISMANGLNYPSPPNPDAPTISRYDPVTKTVYLYWRYNANNERAFIDTLYYIGPR